MGLSAEERDILDMQQELLRQSLDATNAGNELNQLLMPIMLEEAGYTVEYGDVQVDNKKYLTFQKQKQRWEEALRSGKLSRAEEFQAKTRLEEINNHLKNLDRYDTERQITGLVRNEDPARDLREQNELALLQRQGQALRGELPVAPGLLSDLDEQEAQLRESLLQNLGTGFETSTPGIEALAEFGERKNAILEATRRDDIATAGRLGNEMGGFMESLAGSRTGRVSGAASLPFQGASNLMQVAGGYGNISNQLYNNRALDFQMQQANNAPGGLESLLYQGAGTASTFGLGKLFGVF